MELQHLSPWVLERVNAYAGSRIAERLRIVQAALPPPAIPPRPAKPRPEPKVPGIPPEVRQESTVLVARALLRAGKPAEAEAELKGLAGKLSTTDPQRPNLEVALAQCRLAQGQLGQVEAPLRAALQNTSDATVRAAAHNLLGDY